MNKKSLLANHTQPWRNPNNLSSPSRVNHIMCNVLYETVSALLVLHPFLKVSIYRPCQGKFYLFCDWPTSFQLQTVHRDNNYDQTELTNREQIWFSGCN